MSLLNFIQKYFTRRRNMTSFIKVTRIYKDKATGELKTQNYTLAKVAVIGFRPSNRLGYPEHRATITLISGDSIDVQDTYATLNTALGVR
jgi:hypothetical protein